MKGNIFKTHKIRAVVFLVVVAVGILATVQQIGRIQDSRQHAASDVTIQVRTSTKQISIGQASELFLDINNAAGKKINSFDVTITYDPQYLEYKSSYIMPPFQSLIVTPMQDVGKIRIAAVIENNKTLGEGSYGIGGTVASVTFAAKKITPSTPISFANADVAALDDTKNVTGTIIGTKLSILDSASITPAPSYNPTPTPPSKPTECKKGANTLTASSGTCKVGLIKKASVVCYDGYPATIDLGYCMDKATLNKQIEKVCSGRTSCSPKYNPTPTPTVSVSCDINKDRRINKTDYDTLLNCAVRNKGNNCKNSDLNNDGRIDAVDINIYLRSCGSLTTPTPTPKIAKR